MQYRFAAQLPPNPDLLKVYGATYKAGFVYARTEADAKAIAEKASHTRSKAFTASKGYTPSDADKELVKSFFKSTGAEENRPDVEKFGFYEAIASSTAIDRDKEALTPAALAAIGESYKASQGKAGRAILVGHDRSAIAGGTYHSEIRAKEDGGQELVVRYYITDKAQYNGQAVQYLVNSGSIPDVSIGFRYGKAETKEHGQGYITYLDVDPTGTYATEGLELSVVPLGANYDAHIKSGDKPLTIEKVNNVQMKNKTFQVKLGDKSYDLTVEASESDITLKGADQIEAAYKAVSDENAAFKSQIEAERKPLEEAIPLLETELSKATKLPLAALKAMSVTELRAYQDSLLTEKKAKNGERNQLGDHKNNEGNEGSAEKSAAEMYGFSSEK